MKYLVGIMVFLLLDNLQAAIKVDISTQSGRKDGSFIFETQAEADAWKADNIANDSWGKPDRWLKKEEGDMCANGERTQGNMVEGFYQECFYPQEYSIVETDITAEEDAKKAKKASYELTLKSIRAKLINNEKLSADDIEAWIKIKEGL